MEKTERPKIGLALGSGGAKGLSHIGVIKILEENNIPIDFIAGTSMGAMVGGFYAAHKDIAQIEKIALSANLRQLASLIDPSVRQGLLTGKKIQAFIESYIDQMDFNNLKIPFVAVATNLKSGEVNYLKEGDVSSAIRASLSIPLVFKPLEREGLLLGDGGLSQPVPVRAARDLGADIVIAVNLDAHYFSKNNIEKASLYRLAQGSVNILRYNLAGYEIKEADLIVEPEVLEFGLVGWKNFLKSKKIISIGEEAMKKSLPELKRIYEQV